MIKIVMEMIKAKFRESSFLLKAFILIALMLFFSGLSIALWALVTGQSQSTESLKFMQLLQSVGMFIIPCLLGAFLWSPHPLQFIGLTQKCSFSSVAMVIIFMILALPFINLLSYLNQQMELPAFLSNVEAWMKESEKSAAQLTERFLQMDGIGMLMFNLFLMALLPAFSEELLFRGTLQKLFSEKGSVHIAIWICAILFSAIHMQFYGFIPRMLMGALFGYMFVWSGSLWLPILAHFTNNAVAVFSYYMVQKYRWNEDILDSLGTCSTLWIGIASGIFVVVGIYLLRRSLTISNASSRKSMGN